MFNSAVYLEPVQTMTLTSSTNINGGVSLRGELRVPSDRSITVRAVLLAAIADGNSVINMPLECDDTVACMNVVEILTSSKIETTSDRITVSGCGLYGLTEPNKPLFCGSSGATMRLLAGLMVGQRFDSVLDGTPQLRKRPMSRVSMPLGLMGAHIVDSGGCAPLHISGVSSTLASVSYAPPVASAQVKSAVLLAGMYGNGITRVIEDAPTRDHTERMLASMGAVVTRSRMIDGQHWQSSITAATALAPLNITIPADFSSAAFFMVAACIVPHSNLTLKGVGINETRTGLLDCLKTMGASVAIANVHHAGGEPVADVHVVFAELSAMHVGGELTARTIDELPILAVAATQATGVTVVRNAEELRVKESNRIEGFVAELVKMGADIAITADGFEVRGPTRLHGATVNSLGDHRVAMALAVAALVADGETTVTDSSSVSKTYPGFFADLATVSVRQ